MKHARNLLSLALLLAVPARAAEVVLAEVPAEVPAERAAERAAERPIAQLMQAVGFDQNLGAALPLDAAFVDADGDPVRLGELFSSNRPVVLAFVYYECPMLCTLVLNGLVRSLRDVPLEVGRDFEVVAIGIDPDETPELARLKRDGYVEAYGRGDGTGWHFLTGREADIRRVADAAGFRYVYVEEKDEYAHASGVIIAAPDGRLARYFFGVEFPDRDLRLGLVEAARGEIGSLVDRVLLLCYHYDPLTGRYGLAIMNSIRVLGGLTVAVLIASIARALRRERRPAAGEGS